MKIISSLNVSIVMLIHADLARGNVKAVEETTVKFASMLGKKLMFLKMLKFELAMRNTEIDWFV